MTNLRDHLTASFARMAGEEARHQVAEPPRRDGVTPEMLREDAERDARRRAPIGTDRK